MNTSAGDTIIVRESGSIRSFLEEDDWRFTEMIAALSADPRTFDELDRAWQRYRPDGSLGDLAWTEFTGSPPDGPWVVFDLACQRIVCGCGAELPEDQAAYQRDEGPSDRSMPVAWVNLPPHWERRIDCDWRQALPPVPMPTEPLDFRGVLYGRALAAWVAQRTLEVSRDESLPRLPTRWTDTPADSSPTDAERQAAKQWHALAVRVHADWLMTPRDDLDGHAPRLFLHRDRPWVERELGNRQLQWSRTGSAPRALDRDTFAYRFGPMGLHEVVMYFDLCRHVANTAWKTVGATPTIDQESLTEILHARSVASLREEVEDGDPTPPADIIEKERRRIPLTGEQGTLDCDCPLCRMEAEGVFGTGPSFACFDGHHLELDDEFAFSLHETREEWERDQVGFQEWSARMDARGAEEDSRDESGDLLESVWKNTFINEDAIRRMGQAPLLTTMSLAMRVGELVTDLDVAGGHRPLIDQLNNTFDAYRADDCPNPPLAKADLADALEQIATALPPLTPKVADLQSQIDESERARTDWLS